MCNYISRKIDLLASVVSIWLSQYIQAGEQILKITAFALILVLVILALGALGKILEATIKIVMLGWVNRLLGVAFSFLKCLLVMGLLAMAFNSFNNTFKVVNSAELEKSTLYTPLKETAETIFQQTPNKNEPHPKKHHTNLFFLFLIILFIFVTFL